MRPPTPDVAPGDTADAAPATVSPPVTAEVSEERRAILRLRWYMLLRWAGVAALYGGGTLARELGDNGTSGAASNVLAPLAIAYNLAVWYVVRGWTRQPPRDWRRCYRILGNAQCAADLLVLTVGLHYAGGIESPLVSMEPLAVVVVAGLVLPARDSLAQGVLACLLVDAVFVGEATGILPHIFTGDVRPELYDDGAHLASVIVLHNTITLLVAFIVLFIARHLRSREAELARLYGQERATVERLHELDTMKSAFLGTVSHELRTPLTVIRGVALTLRRHWPSMDDRAREEQLATLDRQSERLHRLVENLLDLSALDAGRATVEVDDVELAPIAAAAVAAAAVDNVHVDVPHGLRVVADASRTEQVLVNLLDNARKYGAPPIEVHAGRQDGVVAVAVTDRGPGVPPEQAGSLFDRFTQGERSSARTGARTGVGLGLALVKGYVESQGGRVWLERPAEGGCRFVFTLPASAPAAVESAERPPEGVPAGVDDPTG